MKLPFIQRKKYDAIQNKNMKLMKDKANLNDDLEVSNNKFRKLAVDRDYKKKDGTKETDFINMQIMGTRAEKLAEYLTKGKLIATSGSLRVNNYKDKEGNNRSFTFVNVKDLEFIPTGKKEDNQPTFTPSFEPQGLDPQGWDAISEHLHQVLNHKD